MNYSCEAPGGIHSELRITLKVYFCIERAVPLHHEFFFKSEIQNEKIFKMMYKLFQSLKITQTLK